MYIEKYPKGYRAHVQKNGQRKSAIWPTKREAQAWGLKTEAEFELHRLSDEASVTFGEAATPTSPVLIRHHELARSSTDQP